MGMVEMSSVFFLLAVGILFTSSFVETVFAESDIEIPKSELKRQVNEHYMAVEFSHYLIDNKVNWNLPDMKFPRHHDVGRNTPWTLCTQLAHPDDKSFFLSVTNLDDHIMSEVLYHELMPENYAFFVSPPQIITDPDRFTVTGDEPHEWLRSCWKFDYSQDFFTDENPYQHTSEQHRDYLMCKTAIDLNLYETDVEKLGKNLDWNNYAEQTTTEYLQRWNFGDHPNMFSEILRYQTFVDSRDTLPPKMHTTVSFDYSEGGNLKTFDERFEINPLYSPALFLELQNSPVTEESEEVVCDSNAELIDGICQMIIVRDAPHEIDGTFLGIFFVLFLVIVFVVIALIVRRIRK